MDDNGCTDGNCKLRIGKCQGQHTNGGCRCLRDIPTPLRLRVEKKLAAVTKERDAAESRLRNLLAVIHRDGGHYTEEHGLGKSSEDAIDVVVNTRGKRDAAVALLREVEWSADAWRYSDALESCCPECINFRDMGHAPGCRLAAIINKETR